ncbi:MAG: hypothetical protein FWE27_06825 [Defluviitaleaceae bacterium]|nr:hypothetical protein [Defluviitaleaceae bacterium]
MRIKILLFLIFLNEDSEISGYAVLFCEWLATFLLGGLETCEIDFTGDLIRTEERLQIYEMTNPIAMRHVKGFRLAGSRPLPEIAVERPVRVGFMTATATINRVTSEMEPGTYEAITLDEFTDVYPALVSGEIDVYYYSGVAEINFLEHADIVSESFYTLIYVTLSMATQNRELSLIISVVGKALENNDFAHINTQNMDFKAAAEELIKMRCENG